MNTPLPSQPAPSSRIADDEAQLRAWLELRGQVAALHARLEYMKLMLILGVRTARR